jgi:hypothetical protein
MKNLDDMINDKKWYNVRSDADGNLVYKYLQKPSIFDDKDNNPYYTDKKTDKKTDKETDKETDKKTDKETDKKTDKETDKETDKKTDKETDKETDKKTDKETDKETDKKTDNDYEEIVLDKQDLIEACRGFSGKSLDEELIRAIEKKLKLPKGILDEYRVLLEKIFKEASNKKATGIPKKAPEKTRKCTKRNPAPVSGKCPEDIPYLRDSCCYKTRKSPIIGNNKKDKPSAISWGHEINSNGEKSDITKAVSNDDYTAMGFENILFPE